MADIDTLNISGADYDIKDKTARTQAAYGKLIAYLETGNTASRAYVKGMPINWKGTLYYANNAIASGASFDKNSGGNLTAVSNLGMLVRNINVTTDANGNLIFKDLINASHTAAFKTAASIVASDIVDVGQWPAGTQKSVSSCKSGDLIIVVSPNPAGLIGGLVNCTEVTHKAVTGYIDPHDPANIGVFVITVLKVTTDGTAKFSSIDSTNGPDNYEHSCCAYKIPATFDGNSIANVGTSTSGTQSVSASNAKVGEIFITAGVGNDVSYNSRCTSLVKQVFPLFQRIYYEDSGDFSGDGFLAIGKVNTAGTVTISCVAGGKQAYQPAFGVLKVKL